MRNVPPMRGDSAACVADEAAGGELPVGSGADGDAGVAHAARRPAPPEAASSFSVDLREMVASMFTPYVIARNVTPLGTK
jgi:hypothetical protein